MADQWKAPPAGVPVWIGLFATDVPRARAFYTTVFRWEFPETQPADGESVTFMLPEKTYGLGGSIAKADESQRKKGAQMVMMYLMVDDLKKSLETIVANGGTAVGDVQPAGAHGSLQRFEDTEGNLMGIYALHS